MSEGSRSANLERVAALLSSQQAALDWKGVAAPSPEAFVKALRAVLFPQFRHEARVDEAHLVELDAQALHLSRSLGVACGDWHLDLIAALPELSELIYADARRTLECDPAAKSLDEVIIAYPGFASVSLHRVAHFLWERRVPLIPRFLAEFSHSRTGVDIHPGARIGRQFCVDHGTGVVIGETTVIGDRVTIYQGVTLGALRVRKGDMHVQRHPTLEDDVTVYANATILGGRTVIGRGAVIGGNVWITRSVPAGAVVVRKPDEPNPTDAGDEYII